MASGDTAGRRRHRSPFPAEKVSAPPRAQNKGTQAGRSPCLLFESLRDAPSQQHLRETRGLGQHLRQLFRAGLGVGPDPHSSSVSWELDVGGDQPCGPLECRTWTPATSPRFPARGAGAAPSSEAIVRVSQEQSWLSPGVPQYSSHRRPEGRATESGRYPRWAGGLPVGRTWREHPSVPPGSRPRAVPPPPGPGQPLKAHTDLPSPPPPQPELVQALPCLQVPPGDPRLLLLLWAHTPES